MLYLLFSILLSTLIVVVFKLFTRFGINNLQAIIVNYLVAAVLGYSLSGTFSSIPDIPQQNWFVFALLSGFFLMFTFNVFALSSQKAGIAITAVSSKMSVVIPVVLGVVLYGETLNIYRVMGIVFALLAFYLTFKKEAGTPVRGLYLLLPLLLFLGNGTNDSLLNYAERRLINGDLMFYLSSAFLFSLVFGLLLYLVKSMRKPEAVELKNVVAGVVLGLLNFGSTYYFLRCLGLFETTVFFPVFNVSIVTTAALIGFFMFDEKLRPVNWVGIALAIAAIVVLAVG